MFKPIQSVVGTAGRAQHQDEGAGAAHVFMVMHGFYGNLFLSKFSTGLLNDENQDLGVLSAQKVWGHGLREYDADTVKTALRRCQERHPEFPPSLPQFTQLCEAARPRPVYRPDVPAQPAIEMSAELRQQRRAAARAAATEAAHRKLEAEQPTGLDLLKQSIAAAIADGGGDEAAALLQMDRIFAPKGKA